MKFNLNHDVRVKLTPFGIQKLEEDHNRINASCNGALGPFVPPQVDAEGWSKMQMWVVMNKLGPYFINGGPVPLETEIDIIEKHQANIGRQIYEHGRTRMIQELRRALDADAGLAETSADIPDDIDDVLLWTKWLRS